ncbi:hypothetical protein JYU14_00795 [Simkania negevensis]|uniref:threonine--tRNA ligase n=1 Tax=Simkania negevensis TaxID=83561 RepID=A0ABS3AQN4_9BACT|nr:hypothetical protein [Simkania negevensis]
MIEQPSLEGLRATAAALFAHAILDLFPKAKLIRLGVHPSGFYCDSDFPFPIDDQLLRALEERMRTLALEAKEVRTLEMTPANAAELFNHRQQHLLAKKLGQMKGPLVTMVEIAGLIFPLQEPCTSNTSFVRAIKLFDVKDVQVDCLPKKEKALRIIGAAYSTKEELKKFIANWRAAKKDDPLILGEKLDLFTSVDSLCFLLPHGVAIRDKLITWWKEESREVGYQAISSPLSFGEKEDTLPTSMLPAHALLFQSRPRSYQELPLRYAETNCLLSTEPNRHLHPFHLHSYTAVDTHTFLTEEQLQDEIETAVAFFTKLLTKMDLPFKTYLALPNKKRLKKNELWERGVSVFEDACRKAATVFQRDDRIAHRFFGPTLYFSFVDALGDEWPGPYLSLDLHHPLLLNLKYEDAKGLQKNPCLLASSAFGPIERLILLLIQHNKEKVYLRRCGDRKKKMVAPKEFVDTLLEEICSRNCNKEIH